MNLVRVKSLLLGLCLLFLWPFFSGIQHIPSVWKAKLQSAATLPTTTHHVVSTLQSAAILPNISHHIVTTLQSADTFPTTSSHVIPKL